MAKQPQFSSLAYRRPSAKFRVSVIQDACRAIDLNGSLDAAWKSMARAGVHRIQSGDILIRQKL